MTEVIVVQPTEDIYLCSWDIVERELLTTTATIEFSVFESQSLDINDFFSR